MARWRNRPNWRNEAEYPNPNAAYSHFAWEFLRRNEDFQSACVEARTSDAKNEVASHWELQRFKKFSDDYVREDEPLFTAGWPIVVKRMSPRGYPHPEGRVAVLFDLRSVKFNRSSLQSQLLI